MIRIVENAASFAESLPFEHMNEKWREDKKLHEKFNTLYETNFKRYLHSVGKSALYVDLRSTDNSNVERSKMKDIYKLKSKYDKIRPYIYTYKKDFFVLYSETKFIEEAVLFQLEKYELLYLAEKKLSKLNKIRFRANKSMLFLTDLDALVENEITKEDLEKACEDILYGVLALEYACEKCSSPHVNNTDKKFFRDSFIIHFRALYNFFYKETTPYKDENLAKYYLPDYQNFINRRADKKSFVINGISYITKANIQLAHLSLERRSDNYQLGKAGDWPVEDIKSKLDITIRAFFECLPEPKKPWFKNAEKLIKDLPIPQNIKKLYN